MSLDGLVAQVGQVLGDARSLYGAAPQGGGWSSRLDHRFRLLVGSRRGLERHHTLRHAVAWSYDHLDDAEKSLLARCSVFSGGSTSTAPAR